MVLLNLNVLRNNLFNNSPFCYRVLEISRRKGFKHTSPFVCHANLGNTTVDPETVKKADAGFELSPEVKAWFDKLDPFDKDFTEIPDESKDPAGHKVALTNNAKLQLAYIRDQLAKNGMSNAVADAYINAVSTVAAGDIKEIQQLIVIKKALAKGKFKGFMDACSACFQRRRDLTQQATGLVCTQKEFQDNLENLQQMSRVRAAWGKYTSTDDYIKGTTLDNKRTNQKAYEKWIVDNSSKLSTIMNLTQDDIPASVGPNEQAAFLVSPTLQNKKKMDALLKQLKNDAILAWRADAANFNVATWLGSK